MLLALGGAHSRRWSRARSTLDDDDIASFAPGLALASRAPRNAVLAPLPLLMPTIDISRNPCASASAARSARARPRSRSRCAARCATATSSPSSPTTSTPRRTRSSSCATRRCAPERIIGVETGGCPHTAIREDASINLEAVERLAQRFGNLDLVFVESGGDNLAATFTPELSDLTLYVIDVAAGDKIPRKGGPGITRSDLLVINKIDLAPMVGASLEVMDRDARRMRGERPFVFTNLKTGQGLDTVVALRRSSAAWCAPDRHAADGLCPIRCTRVHAVASSLGIVAPRALRLDAQLDRDAARMRSRSRS